MVPQANPALSTIPSAGIRALTALPIHLIECRSARFGTYFRERGIAETIRDTTISDLASGQVDDAYRVLRLDPERGTCEDVSEEIAKEVAIQAADYHGYIPAHCRDFVHRHCALAFVNEVERRAA